MIRILNIDYTINNKSLDFYLAGCGGDPHCEGCHNPETWDFNQGDEYDGLMRGKIWNYVKDFDELIENIMIFGGEPLDSPNEDLIKLLKDLIKLKKKIWLFTRYELDEIPNNVKKLCDYIKTGRYDKDLIVDDNVCFGIKLSSSNQKITKL